MGLRYSKLTNRNIQAQRLIEPHIPLRASRVVKGWFVAVAMADVNMSCMLMVFSLGKRTVENNWRFSPL